MAVTVYGDGAITGLTNNIREQFFYPCNGEQITTASGATLTFPNVTAEQDGTTTWTDLTGSSISYTPPSGTKTVIYKFVFENSRDADALGISSFKLFIDSDEVVHARWSYSGEKIGGLVTIEWPIRIGGSADTNTGRVATWTQNKTIKLQYRENSSNSETKAHQTRYWDGDAADTFVIPRIGITALTT